tara:strand:+ start:249 stop:389 length:141 start_codon:yes stop_codon:yes gene_type:complete
MRGRLKSKLKWAKTLVAQCYRHARLDKTNKKGNKLSELMMLENSID